MQVNSCKYCLRNRSFVRFSTLLKQQGLVQHWSAPGPSLSQCCQTGSNRNPVRPLPNFDDARWRDGYETNDDPCWPKLISGDTLFEEWIRFRINNFHKFCSESNAASRNKISATLPFVFDFDNICLCWRLAVHLHPLMEFTFRYNPLDGTRVLVLRSNNNPSRLGCRGYFQIWPYSLDKHWEHCNICARNCIQKECSEPIFSRNSSR